MRFNGIECLIDVLIFDVIGTITLFFLPLTLTVFVANCVCLNFGFVACLLLIKSRARLNFSSRSSNFLY
jgi:hypothetical protein